MACIVYQTNKKSGTVYAYRCESHRDPVTKKPKTSRTYLGRVDPTSGAIIEKGKDGKRNRSKLGEKTKINGLSPEEAAKKLDQLTKELEKTRSELAELQKKYEKMKTVMDRFKKLCTEIG